MHVTTITLFIWYLLFLLYFYYFFKKKYEILTALKFNSLSKQKKSSGSLDCKMF